MPLSVDLRSDTVTRPSPEMYVAMQTAVLGDDVLGDDPTVLELEAEGAARMGKEAAMFVPSGTMGNQIALAVHCARGDAILIEEEAHILYYEVGAPAIVAGVVSWTLPSTRGVMDPAVVESRVLKRSIHTPGTSLLCLENTHNRAGGTIIPVSTMKAYRTVADRHGMKIHIDGARIFNAAVGLGRPVAKLAADADSVNFCLSKGLRSPVGSLLCGTQAFIDGARIWRKRLGGGMRQAGLLAACGLVSLRLMVDRLAEDHGRTSTLAKTISGLPGLAVDMAGVQTNILIVETTRPAEEWQSSLSEAGVQCFTVAENRIRLVFHADVDDAGLAHAQTVFTDLSKQLS